MARKIIIEGDNNTKREDLKNGPCHVFGSHGNCKPYYCRFVNSDEKDTNLLQDLKSKAPTVWALICAAIESVMSKCHRLTNDTTNVVENFMSVLSKFICGKRLNLYKRGSYQRRVYVAGKSQLYFRYINDLKRSADFFKEALNSIQPNWFFLII